MALSNRTTAVFAFAAKDDYNYGILLKITEPGVFIITFENGEHDEPLLFSAQKSADNTTFNALTAAANRNVVTALSVVPSAGVTKDILMGPDDKWLRIKASGNGKAQFTLREQGGAKYEVICNGEGPFGTP